MDLRTVLFGKDRKLGRTFAARSAIVDLTGSLQSAIFLSKVAYWWFANGRKPFYKFNAPCSHDLCRAGDTWLDELPFGRDAFERARSRVAVKVTTGTSKKEVRATGIILYWTDSNRVTWYELNERLLIQRLKQVLGVDNSAQGQHYLEETKIRVTLPSSLTTDGKDKDSQNVENTLDIIESNGWWQRALGDLQGRMTRATYDRLLRGSQARRGAYNAVIVVVKDRGAVDLLRRHRERVREAIEAAGQSVGEIDFMTG